MKIPVPCIELDLPLPERRKRARHFARLTAGCNFIRPRELRRLPNGASKSAQRKAKRMMRRIAKRHGWTKAEHDV